MLLRCQVGEGLARLERLLHGGGVHAEGGGCCVPGGLLGCFGRGVGGRLGGRRAIAFPVAVDDVVDDFCEAAVGFVGLGLGEDTAMHRGVELAPVFVEDCGLEGGGIDAVGLGHLGHGLAGFAGLFEFIDGYVEVAEGGHDGHLGIGLHVGGGLRGAGGVEAAGEEAPEAFAGYVFGLVGLVLGEGAVV